MDDLLYAAKHTPFMTTIDLKSGYHQISIRSSDRDKTAFVCPFGTFRFLRMPFGLKTSPATFQRLIDKFHSGLKDMLVLSYIDDIIVFSETFKNTSMTSKPSLKDCCYLNFRQISVNATLLVSELSNSDIISLVQESKLIRTRQLPLWKWFLPKMDDDAIIPAKMFMVQKVHLEFCSEIKTIEQYH
ncbi:hypothetical protein AVEN_90052-1 [Araneus ventricosus]|uniref:Reverse transcriptase domain-containing protein n=1 Tax=Araneus ventricosus TaxID=182803 RepID=A0A4Y2R3G7_ARAVE|nr:hypothetical protein AVEN_90052-1 [Araneus ventricosus]